MSAIPLLYKALAPRSPPEEPKDGLCCMLGTTEPCIGRGYAIKPSFTNLDLLRAPDSDRVSVRAWRVLTHSMPAAEGKKRDTFPLMQSSWVVSDALTLLDRQTVRRRVIEAIPAPAWSAAPWAGYVTTSYKKHGSLRAPVNTGNSQRWLFELDIVDCTDRVKVLEWWERMRTARESGIPRPVIETLDCSLHLMGKYPSLWREFERWARPKYQSSLYRYLTYLLPSEEELKGARSAA
jgi:hypothetical protein